MVPAAEGEPTIANYLSLYATAALAVWVPLHVSVCACVCVYACVIVGEIGKLLVIDFSILKEGRRNVEEGDEEGRVLRRPGRNMQSEYKGKQRRD